MLTSIGGVLETTREGFLLRADQWSPEVAEALAEAHGIVLSEAHWEVLEALRQYVAQGNEPPPMRKLSSLMKAVAGEQRAGSIYLMKLFGPSPAKMAARLAGLPKPRNCF